MIAFDNKYSYFVFFAKIFLPISALLILSTLFLLVKFSDSSQIVSISDIGTDHDIANQQITSPIYSGLTDDGSILEFSSRTISPGILNPKKVYAKDVVAKITTPNGSIYEVYSNKGSYNDKTSTVDLKKNVVVHMPEGYKIFTDNLSTHVKKTLLESPTPIIAESPLGTLKAGNMLIIEKNNQHLLIFKKGVTLQTKVPG